MSSEPAHDPPSAGNQDSPGSLVTLPEVGTTGPDADHVRNIVVADDTSIGTEVELLPLTVSLHVPREPSVKPSHHWFSLTPANSIAAPIAGSDCLAMPRR